MVRQASGMSVYYYHSLFRYGPGSNNGGYAETAADDSSIDKYGYVGIWA